MQLSKTTKVLIGIGTIWTILYPVLFLAVWLNMAMSFQDTTAQPKFDLFIAIFPLHCFTILLTFALDAVYLIHILKNTGASDVVRIVLAIGVFSLPYVAMPIYFYFFIWREKLPTWALPPPAPKT